MAVPGTRQPFREQVRGQVLGVPGRLSFGLGSRAGPILGPDEIFVLIIQIGGPDEIFVLIIWSAESLCTNYFGPYFDWISGFRIRDQLFLFSRFAGLD